MRFFQSLKVQETRPPTEEEIHKDRDNELLKILRECGLERIDVKTKWHENEAGLHLFVRLYKCSSDHWTELHEHTGRIKRKLRHMGMNVVEIFYAHSS